MNFVAGLAVGAGVGIFIGSGIRQKVISHLPIPHLPARSLATPIPQKIHLLVGIYDEKNDRRLQEFVTCLEKNIANPWIEKIHLFDESEHGLSATIPAISHPKVMFIRVGRRMKFCDYFRYANERLHGSRVAIANTDIFFDESLAALSMCPLHNTLIALSRWEPMGGHQWAPMDSDVIEVSQDVWIFDAPMNPFYCDFYLGKLGCDNRLAYEAHHAGLSVINPYMDLKTYHVHESRIRTYTKKDKIPGPYYGVALSRLNA